MSEDLGNHLMSVCGPLFLLQQLIVFMLKRRTPFTTQLCHLAKYTDGNYNKAIQLLLVSSTVVIDCLLKL